MVIKIEFTLSLSHKTFPFKKGFEKYTSKFKLYKMPVLVIFAFGKINILHNFA